VFHTKVVEKIKTYFMFNNRAAYEIVWENAAELGRSQMTIWRIRIADCRAVYSHSAYCKAVYRE
jgi:hypothetical protein